MPTFMKQFSKSHREKGLFMEGRLDTFVLCRDIAGTKIYLSAAKWNIGNPFYWLGIVIIDAMKAHLGETWHGLDVSSERGDAIGINRNFRTA